MDNRAEKFNSIHLYERRVTRCQQVQCGQQHPAVARLLAVLDLQKLDDGTTRRLGALVARSSPDFGYHQS